MADSLDDGFVIDSDVESLAAGEEAGDSSADDAVLPSSTAAAPAKATGKADQKGEVDPGKESKKRKRKAQQERRKRRRAELETTNASQKPLPLLPPDVQAEHVKAFQKDAFPKMTSLELTEMQIPESAIGAVTDLCPERRLDDLCALCRTALPSLDKTLADPSSSCRKQKGTPALLMITGNAMRAADLARPLRGLLPSAQGPGNGKKPETISSDKSRGKNGSTKKAKEKPDAEESESEGPEGADAKPTVAKLFARHFKATEQASYLSTHVSSVAVGTPARIAQLLEPLDEDASAPNSASDGKARLNLDALEAVVIDASWKDKKERTVIDGLDTRGDLFKLLNRAEIRDRLRGGKCRLILF